MLWLILSYQLSNYDLMSHLGLVGFYKENIYLYTLRPSCQCYLLWLNHSGVINVQGTHSWLIVLHSWLCYGPWLTNVPSWPVVLATQRISLKCKKIYHYTNWVIQRCLTSSVFKTSHSRAWSSTSQCPVFSTLVGSLNLDTTWVGSPTGFPSILKEPGRRHYGSV